MSKAYSSSIPSSSSTPPPSPLHSSFNLFLFNLNANLLRKLTDMEQENRKRGREEFGEEKNAAKRQGVNYDQSESSIISSENYIAFGVFDFPWLHEHEEGIISKLSDEYWNFQDTFSSSLDETCTQTEFEFSRQYLYEIPTFNSSISLSFPDNKFEENVDCIWSSFHNQPLQQGIPND